MARQIVALGESDRYFPGLRSWVGFRQTGIEVERNARYDGRPRVSLLGLLRLAKTAMFSFSALPLAIFHVDWFRGGDGLRRPRADSRFSANCLPTWPFPAGRRTSSPAAFFGALNALGISILGEYVIRIYDQVRGRPLYVVDRTVNVSGTLRVPLDVAGTLRVPSDVAGTLRVPSPDGAVPAGDEPYVDLMERSCGVAQRGNDRRGLSARLRGTGREIRGVDRSRVAPRLSLT